METFYRPFLALMFDGGRGGRMDRDGSARIRAGTFQADGPKPLP